MTWTLLGMSCCFIVFVFPIYLLNTFSLGGFVCCFPFKMIIYLLNRSQIYWFSLFKIMKSSFYMYFPWIFSCVFKCLYLCSLFQGRSHIWTYLLFASPSSGSIISICSCRPPTKLKPLLLHPLLVPILPQLRHLCCKKWTVQVTIIHVLKVFNSWKVMTIARRVYLVCNINHCRNAYIRYLRKHLPCIFSR